MFYGVNGKPFYNQTTGLHEKLEIRYIGILPLPWLAYNTVYSFHAVVNNGELTIPVSDIIANTVEVRRVPVIAAKRESI